MLAVGLFILILLILSSALVSGSEVAFFSLTPDDYEELTEEQTKQADRVITLKSKPRFLLATILIANNFINIGIVLLSEHLINLLLGDQVFSGLAQYCIDHLSWPELELKTWVRLWNFLLTVLGVTAVLILFGEIAPKIYARFNSKKLAKMMSAPMTSLMTIFYPLSRMLVGTSTKLEKTLESQSSGNNPSNRDEIEDAIDLAVGQRSDHQQKEGFILKRIIKFNEVPVKQIMRSRVDVISIPLDSSFEDVLKTIRDSGYSRIPVHIENFDEIEGILYAKDLLGKVNDVAFEWQSIIRKEVHYVPESKRINELLKDFQEKKQHMAIVVDEFGGCSGLVTLEDVLEEVIGEISDEFDDMLSVNFSKLDDDTFLFDGKTLINDVSRIVNIDNDIFDEYRGESDSIAGLMLEGIGRMPTSGFVINFPDFKLTAEKVNKVRIEQVKIERVKK